MPKEIRTRFRCQIASRSGRDRDEREIVSVTMTPSYLFTADSDGNAIPENRKAFGRGGAAGNIVMSVSDPEAVAMLMPEREYVVTFTLIEN